MAKGALGLIEVKGYLGAVVAADAAVKAANVSLLNIESVKAGLRTVQLTGDVGAVKAAVDAAVQAVQDRPYYLASHVIPRLDEQTEKILKPKKRVKAPSQPVLVDKVEEAVEVVQTSSLTENGDVLLEQAVEVVEEVTQLEQESELVEEGTHFEEETVSEAPPKKYHVEELEKLKVVELRKIAYREDQIKLTKREIKFGNKVTLINALIKLEREK